MSRIYHSQNPDDLFKTRAEIEDHILSKTSNAGGKIGTELELFVTDSAGRPLPFAGVEAVFEALVRNLPNAERVTEQGRTVGLHVPGLGDVSLEPGGQIELSPQPCTSLEELDAVNRVMRNALQAAAMSNGYEVRGQGHMETFLHAEDMPRSRFHAYYAYCRHQYGAAAEELINTMKSCCGLQVNVDPMGDEFHEIYRALLLVDVAHSLAQRTVRQQRLHDTYASLAPEQLTPVFNSLAVRNNEELAVKIVDRILKLKVPFVPDPTAAEGYQSTLRVYGHAPTVGELLVRGALTADILDNALSLQLTMPNLRRHGVVETRAPDAPETTQQQMDTAAIYVRYAYDRVARTKLLHDFAKIKPEKLEKAFLDRFDMNEKTLMAFDLGGGQRVSDLTGYFGLKRPSLRSGVKNGSA
jgi:hypothetical protein